MQAKPTVLAVDDTPSNLVALEAVLEKEFEVRVAHSGRAAIAMLKDDPNVAVIVIDIQMPGMDGYEAAREIKQLPGCEDIPIVFLTAVYSEDPHIKRGYAVGAVDYFTKPFDPDLLRLKIAIYASFRERAKEREKQLRETEELLRAERELFEELRHLPLAVIVVDASARIREANADTSRILRAAHGIDADAVARLLGWWDSAGKLVEDRGALLAAALRGESGDADLPITCLDGSTKSVRAHGSPMRTSEGGVIGAIVVLQDVSEPIRIEAELADRIAELRKHP